MKEKEHSFDEERDPGRRGSKHLFTGMNSNSQQSGQGGKIDIEAA